MIMVIFPSGLLGNISIPYPTCIAFLKEIRNRPAVYPVLAWPKWLVIAVLLQVVCIRIVQKPVSVFEASLDDKNALHHADT